MRRTRSPLHPLHMLRFLLTRGMDDSRAIALFHVVAIPGVGADRSFGMSSKPA